MKKNISLTLVISLMFAATGLATVRTVSNHPLGGSQYNTLQAAFDAASNGDSLLLEGTGIEYTINQTNCEWNKSLVVIGAGVKTNSHSFQRSIIRALCNNGGFFMKSSGNKFFGIEFVAEFAVETGDTITELLFEDCVFKGNLFIAYNWHTQNYISGYISNLTIKNCICKDAVIIANGSNILITNSLLNDVENPGAGTNFVIDHCIFFAQPPVVSNAIIMNSIFYNFLPYSTGTANNSYLNNICRLGGNFPTNDGNTGSGNITNTNPQFINLPINVFNFDDFPVNYNCHLQPGSPAIGAATNGTDIGIHGGVGETFTEAGEPKVTPIMRSVQLQNSIVNPNSSINVQINVSKPDQ